ncbi:MAG: PD-(D/E)XK nuclease family protein [Bacteroidaceae bacterium]
MTPFLKEVAQDLIARYGCDLSRIVVVFPNKRANLFFNDYLASLTTKPLWSPTYLTISSLFHSLSELEVVDTIEAVCELYKIYVTLLPEAETMDAFYGWGEILLADFDDVDKNLVDAPRLYRNIRDIKNIEMEGFVTEEQEKVLAEFFSGFSLQKNSELKEKFLALWEVMLPLYEQLNTRLRERKLAYEGALYREVIQKVETEKVDKINQFDQYVFVGFNVLDRVEERLFQWLKKQGKALFYWDYDIYYTHKNPACEAGTFIRRNLLNFPCALDETHFDNMSKGNLTINFISATTENAQARYVAPWLEIHLTHPERQTAVVLCNETLLQPVLHALPEAVEKINVTNGFPLTHTPAYTLVESMWPQMGTRASTETQPLKEVQLKLLDDIAFAIKEKAQAISEVSSSSTIDERLLAQLYAESYFRAYTLLSRFSILIEQEILSVGLLTLHRLIRQVLRTTSIPFHGEPAEGLQVMGVLETRGLDFEHVLMLSVNEGQLPKSSSSSSFIPYTMRKSYGLTTPELKTSVYAYYFYRLIQRARYVTMMYNSSTEGLVRGEMSRFLSQLLVETTLPIEMMTLQSSLVIPTSTTPIIPKPKDLYSRCKSLSPSALNTYLRCPLQFYFNKVAGIREPDAPLHVMEANVFGTLFHSAAELMYKKLTEKNKLIVVSQLDELGKNKGALLTPFIRQAFETNKLPLQRVIEEVVRMYLEQIIANDKRLAPFEIDEMEEKHYVPIIVKNAGNEEVRVGGVIDRVDKVNLLQRDGQMLTTLRVVDYKTGGEPESARNMEQLITPDEKHPHYLFQAFLYSFTLCGKTKHPIAPALFFVHKSAGEDYNPYLDFGGKGEVHGKEKVLNFQLLEKEFKETLITLLEEIFDSEKPFEATPFESHCNNCPYKVFCNK